MDLWWSGLEAPEIPYLKRFRKDSALLPDLAKRMLIQKATKDAAQLPKYVRPDHAKDSGTKNEQDPELHYTLGDFGAATCSEPRVSGSRAIEFSQSFAGAGADGNHGERPGTVLQREPQR